MIQNSLYGLASRANEAISIDADLMPDIGSMANI